MIFPKPKGKAAKKLGELERAVVEARQRERDVNLEHNQAQRKAARLEEELTEAYARGTPPAKLKEELSDARRALREDWPPQVEGARRATERALEDKARFISGHFGALAGELLPEAEAAQDAVQDAIDAVQISRQRWTDVASRFEALMRDVPGVRGLAEPMPSLRLGGLDDVLSRIDGEVPVPAPRIPDALLPEGAPEALRLGGEEAEEEDEVKEAV